MNNAAPLLQTADAWMGTIQNMMGRMTELAVRAGDGTLADVNRFALQQEFAQMQLGILAITTGPDAMGQYNGIPLFQGNTASLAGGTNYVTPDLTASSNAAIGGNLTWGALMTESNIASKANAAMALPALNIGLDHMGSLRNELGVVWGLVSPTGSPLNPSATAAASLADKLQYLTFHQTMNALGSGALLMQA